MKMKYHLPLVCLLPLAVSAFGQTKMTATMDCGKPEQTHAIPVPDRAGYAFEISQTKCSYTKSFGIEGLDAKTFASVGFNEVTGSIIRGIFSGVTTFTNGDKSFARGSVTADASNSPGKWSFTGGTGKLRGIKGGGTYTCKLKGSGPDSGSACEIEGAYTLPVAKK
jgi:hypothetical protein